MIFKRSLPVLYTGVVHQSYLGWDASRCTLGRRNPVLSPADMLIIGAVALIAFGPDQLPKVARRAGQVIRDVQNTSQGFIREMERAADDLDIASTSPTTPSSMYGSFAEPTPAYEPFSSHDADVAIPVGAREPEGNAAHPFAAYASRPISASHGLPIDAASTSVEDQSVRAIE